MSKVEFIGSTADTAENKTINNHKNVTEMRQSKSINFYNNQVDFIALRISKEDATGIKMENLREHPVLKNQYTIDSKDDEHLKNIALYFKKDGSVILKSSMPYFLYGHNHVRFHEDRIAEFADQIKELLKIDIENSKVLDFEYGAFEKMTVDTKTYLKNLMGLKDWDLEYNKGNMKMFGNPKLGLHYKVYDAVANAKVKGTLIKGCFPQEDVIKHEIKFSNPKKYFGREFYFRDLMMDIESTFQDLTITKLDRLLKQFRNNLIEKTDFEFFPKKPDVVHILYTVLKNKEQQESRAYETSVLKEVLSLIDVMELSPSQKSKRRKSIKELEETYDPGFF
ncbi:hypothetical protein [Chryseobacterium salviniae]|uniref:Uncharacterized protein n=1 Tax=Chryseobacterium salviniae TaxID=3101750 RepID=A0ABU6HUD0_9FLAO|nr:hypothetical protein [Chryseobacterium sp. T9W2-O]MEC3876023.1 hypothetical protein [Chryseobacterium sp. T9W2-O]